MKNRSTKKILFSSFLFVSCFFQCRLNTNAQTVSLTITNLVQTSANSFEYDVFITKSGSTVVNLRQYQWALNHTPGLANGGIITHQFLNRDGLLLNLPPVTSDWNGVDHLRGFTNTVAICCGPALSNGTMIKLARMKVQTSAPSFPTNFNPFLPNTPLQPIQLLTTSGRMRTKLGTLINPPNSFFDIIGTANIPGSGEKNVLSAAILPNPGGTNPFLLNTCVNTSNTTTLTVCNSYNWPVTGLTYTSSGVYTKTSSIGTGICIHSEILNLTVQMNLSTSSTVNGCNQYTWPINGQTYTSSGIYTFTTLIGTGPCIHTYTLQLNIYHTNSSHYSVSACQSYVWPINGQTYSLSGNYYAYLLSTSGCVDTAILHLTIQDFYLSASAPDICLGDSSQLQANGAISYTWFPGGFTGSAITVSPPASTIYTVTGSQASGCISTKTINVNVIPLSTAPLVGASVNPICQGSSTTLTASGAGTFLWMPGPHFGTSIIVSPSSTTIYTVTPIISATCPGTSTILITVNPCQTILQLGCFIEGFMQSASQMATVLDNSGLPASKNDCDSILVELHKATPPYNTQYSVAVILNKFGLASCYFPPLSSAYYIVVKHRNAVETWSALPVLFWGPVVSYDFRTAASQAFGSNQKNVAPGVWAFYSGDVVKDLTESVDLADITKVQTDILSYAFGYELSDVNGDGNVDLMEVPIVEFNVNQFVFSYHP